MINCTLMYSINQDEIMRFIQAKVRWPLIVNPGRQTGKTTTACAIAHKCYVNTGLPALFVAPNRNEWRRLEEQWKPFKEAIKFTTLPNLRNALAGIRYSVIIFDEPGLANSYASKVAAEVAFEKDAPVIIFGVA